LSGLTSLRGEEREYKEGSQMPAYTDDSEERHGHQLSAGVVEGEGR